MKEPFQAIQTKQTFFLWGVVGSLSLILIILVYSFASTPGITKEEGRSYKEAITTGASRVKPQELWMEKFNTEHKLQAQRLEAMEKTLEKLLSLQASAQKTLSMETNASTQAGELRQHLKQVQEVGGPTISESPQPQLLPPSPEALAPLPNASQKIPSQKSTFRSNGINKVSLNLTNSKANRTLKTPDNTIPAGAFAQAILLGGVDASTSLQASSDPRPVLLRITNPGTLPRKFTSDLQGCHVLAAAYGDSSSERVFMRLEKLTCTERKTGELLEMDVQGYVSGEDGRSGVRGTVVDRAGPMMRNAAVGGFLSSIGQFLSQDHNPVTFFPSGLAKTDPLSMGDVARQGLAKGAGGALEKYADFYIKRAEQLQPVIQVAAGRKVDIVFSQGVAFSDSAARGAVVKAHDQRRYQQLQETPDKAMEAWGQGGGE